MSGNPGGFSGGRRIAKAILSVIDEKGLDREIALTLVAKALGKVEILGNRKPEYAWFREMLDRIDGPVSASEPADMASAETLDPDIARRIYEATNTGDDPTFDEPGPPASQPPADGPA